MMDRIFFLTAFGALSSFGLALILVNGLPLINNDVHEPISQEITIRNEKIGPWFTIILETENIFSANNPINVTVRTGAVVENWKYIQLECLGAKEPLAEDWPDFPVPPTDVMAENYSEAFEEYIEEMEKYQEKMNEYSEKFRDVVGSNIVHLKKDMNIFKGKKNNLIYRNGGQFDIGVTINPEEGSVFGYGMGDTSYILENVITVSPPEALYTFKQSNVITGLSWATLGLGFFAIGASAIISYILKFCL